MTDIQVLRDFCPRLRDVRMLTLGDIKYIMNCHPELRHNWVVINAANYGVGLRRGTGMVVVIDTGVKDIWVQGIHGSFQGNGHVTALWRGMDGDMVYFDSAPLPYPHPGIEALFARSCSTGETLHCTANRWQGVNVGACAYFVLSFMEYATRHPQIPSEYLMPMFETFLGAQKDETAVLTVEEMIRKYVAVGTFFLPLRDPAYPTVQTINQATNPPDPPPVRPREQTHEILEGLRRQGVISDEQMTRLSSGSVSISPL